MLRRLAEQRRPRGRRRDRADGPAGRRGDRGGGAVRRVAGPQRRRRTPLPGRRGAGDPGGQHAQRDHAGARPGPGHGEVLPGRGQRRPARRSRRWPRPSRRCASCPPAGSPPTALRPTSRTRPSPPSAAAGWSPATCSVTGAGTRSRPVAPPRPPSTRKEHPHDRDPTRRRVRARHRRARRGDAAAGPGGGAHPHRPPLRGVGGRRRVQRGPRHAQGLRPARGRRDRPRRQRDRPPGREPDHAGRCRHLAHPLGAVRRHRARRAQRSQLHRARVRRPRCRRRLRPRPHRHRPDGAGDGGLGRPLRPARRALAAHRRHLRRAVGERRRRRRGGDGGRPQARHRGLLRPQLPTQPVGRDRRPRPSPATSTPGSPDTST